MFCSYYRTVPSLWLCRNVLEPVFCPPVPELSPYLFIFLPRYIQSQLSTLFAFPQSSERKKRTGGKEDIRRNTFKLSARNRVGIFYEMYNLAGCTVVSRNLRSRKLTSDRRFGIASHIVQNSILPPLFPSPLSSKYPPRRGRRTCGARGGTCPLMTLQLEEICR